MAKVAQEDKKIAMINITVIIHVRDLNVGTTPLIKELMVILVKGMAVYQIKVNLKLNYLNNPLICEDLPLFNFVC